MDQATIIRRLMGLRERRAVNQEELSHALGFADRQTLSAIETGKRAIAPAELACAARFFGVSVDYFTDPLELAGEGAFSWRESNGDVAGLQQLLQRGGVFGFHGASRRRGCGRCSGPAPARSRHGRHSAGSGAQARPHH